jgi:hypothetical protein
MVLDHNEARIWADHHGAFGRWVAGVITDTAEAFRVLARLQYRAPWDKKARRRA